MCINEYQGQLFITSYLTCNLYHFVNTLYMYIWSFMINTYIPVSVLIIDLHVHITKTNCKYWFYQCIGSFEKGNLFYIAYLQTLTFFLWFIYLCDNLNKIVDSGCDFFSSSLIYQAVNTFYMKCLLTCFYFELVIYVYKLYSCI